MISAELKQFIEGPQGMSVGTRDADKIPEYTRALGAWVSDSGTVMVHIAEITAEKALANIKDNGLVALTMASPSDFECYQLKGKVVNWRNSGADDKKRLDHYLEIFDAAVQLVGAAPGAINVWPNQPAVVLEIEAQEVFDQTPKIGAGNQIQQS